MTTKTLIMVVLLAGYVGVLPVLLWGLGDLKHIPGGVWRHAAHGPGPSGSAGMISGVHAGRLARDRLGVVWRQSRERARPPRRVGAPQCAQGRSELQAGGAGRRTRSRMIVLSDHELSHWCRTCSASSCSSRFVVLGYIVGLPALVITITTAGPSPAGCGPQSAGGAAAGSSSCTSAYALGGWPALALAYLWRTGRLRHELRRERAFDGTGPLLVARRRPTGRELCSQPERVRCR